MTNITPATLHTALYFRTFDSIGIEIEEEGREKSRSIIIVSLSTRMGGTCTRLNNVKKKVNVSSCFRGGLSVVVPRKRGNRWKGRNV